MLRAGPVSATLAAFLLAVVFAAASAMAAEAPRVLVTIKPVHSLIARVMETIGEPDLLLEGAASPHNFSMRPSDARLLEQADVVFRIGDGLETFLVRPLDALADDARVVTLSRQAGIRLLPAREGGAWDEHVHETDGHDDHADHDHGGYDLHIWLDPENARRIAATAAAVLSEQDPAHRQVYAANAERLKQDLDALEAELRDQLRPVDDVPYVVFHDAYHYFEDRFGGRAVGSIVVGTGRMPGARRLYEIRRKLLELDARCVFREPQFEPSLVQTVIEGTGAGTGVLDPLGADVPAGPDAYFTMMRNLADSLVGCLSR